MCVIAHSSYFVSQGLNNKKNLPAGGAMLRCLENIATFMEALPMDSPSNLWTTISNQFQTFLTKLPCVLPLKVWCVDIWNKLYCHWPGCTGTVQKLWITNQSGLLWMFPNDSANVSRVDLFYLWSIPLITFSLDNNSNSDRGAFHFFLGIFAIHFLCPVSVRLEYCIWEDQYLDNENPSGFNC